MANIKVKFKEAYQDFGAYALLKNVTDKGVLIVDGTEVLNSIADLPTTNTVDGQEKAVIVQNGQVVTTSISNIGGESGGDSTPLSGTEVGKPVTGDIEFEANTYKGLKTLNANGDAYNSVQMGDGGVIISSKSTPTTETKVEVIDADGKCLLTTDNPNPIGYSCSVDCTPYIGDLDYTQKIYVDTHIAFTPIPTSSTDPGIKGQMAVDATYLYICVDTDTWTRVALTW